MSLTAVVFPGQGSQRKGMAIDFLDQFKEAEAVFEEASDILSFNVAEICRNGDPKLDLTEFTQPCLVTAEIAMFNVLQERFGLEARYFGGHSCGEYSALVASGALPLAVALRLVHIRGKLMQWAAPVGFGGMLAITHAERDIPRSEIQALADQEGVDVANDNSARQLVLSGETRAVARLATRIIATIKITDLRVIPLLTSAPFHSRHMMEAEKLFEKKIEVFSDAFQPEKARSVTSNTLGGFHTGKLEDLKLSLTRQITAQVKLRENMDALWSKGVRIIEIGPNRPLSGFFRAAGYEATSIIDLRTAQRILEPITPLRTLSTSKEANVVL